MYEGMDGCIASPRRERWEKDKRKGKTRLSKLGRGPSKEEEEGRGPQEDERLFL